MTMRTCFEKIPDYFVERYDAELVAWGANFKKVGPIKKIVLREGMLADPSPREEYGPQLIQVELVAEVTRDPFMVTVRPLSERDEALIARHCEKLQRAGVPARARLIEPPRPWVPFVPNLRMQ